MGTNDSNWHNRKSVKKGDFAEKIVRDYLETMGYVIYEPMTNKAHLFDKLAVKDNFEFMIAECKAKPKRREFDDTGFNHKHYHKYKGVMTKHNIPIFVFFIDEKLAEVYGNWLTELEKEVPDEGGNYPRVFDGIIYFPMKNMIRNIAKLTPEQCEYLKLHSKNNDVE